MTNLDPIEGMLEAMLLDYSITRLKYRQHSADYIWQKFIRS